MLRRCKTGATIAQVYLSNSLIIVWVLKDLWGFYLGLLSLEENHLKQVVSIIGDFNCFWEWDISNNGFLLDIAQITFTPGATYSSQKVWFAWRLDDMLEPGGDETWIGCILSKQKNTIWNLCNETVYEFLPLKALQSLIFDAKNNTQSRSASLSEWETFLVQTCAKKYDTMSHFVKIFLQAV